MNNSSMVLDRLQVVAGVSTDTGLAKYLSVNRATLGAWRSRDVIPYAKCINIAVSRNISLDWLLMGRGEMNLGSDALTSPLPDPSAGSIGGVNSNSGSVTIDIGTNDKPSHAKNVNNAEDDMLDSYRSLLQKQKEYIFYKIKSMAFENENQTEA